MNINFVLEINEKTVNKILALKKINENDIGKLKL